jgi:hypothetical protein
MHSLFAACPTLPFGSVLADAPKSKNAKVTLVYQHELPNVPGESIMGVLVERGQVATSHCELVTDCWHSNLAPPLPGLGGRARRGGSPLWPAGLRHSKPCCRRCEISR